MGFARAPHETLVITEGTETDSHEWYFDVSFLLSGYSCSYGHGCKGTDLHPDNGCCQIGAHYMDEADEAKVTAVVDRLPDSAFTNAKEIRKRHSVNHGGERQTRVLGGKCIFANDASHPNGAGCSLHQAAIEAGDAENHIDWKPRICSWVPLNQVDLEEAEYDGDPDKTFIGRFENESWQDGTAMMNEWYCLDDTANFQAATPLYKRMKRELMDMVEDKTEVYDELIAYLDKRWNQIVNHGGGGTPVKITLGRPPIRFGTTNGLPAWDGDGHPFPDSDE